MMKKIVFLFLSLGIWTGCSDSKNKEHKSLNTLEAHSGFDLDNVTFNEKPLQLLKTALDSSINSQKEYAEKGLSAAFDYPEGYKHNLWNGAASFYGKAYYSKLLDSIARYKNVYFNRIAFLTHENKTVAVLASAELPAEQSYYNLGKELTKKYGKPSFEPQTGQDVFYEWTTPVSYIQTDFYTGTSVRVSSGEQPKTVKTYTMQLLIFEKNAAAAIHRIQKENYKKTKTYKIMPGDFQLYSQNPDKNLLMANELLSEKFN